MGKRGPKPKPIALRKLEGDPGRLLGKAGAPVEEVALDLPPEKPSSVIADEFASAEWDRLLNSMPPGIYTAADSALIAQYALAWSMLLRAQIEISERGVLLVTEEQRYDDNGEPAFVEVNMKKNPAVVIWMKASDTLLKTGDRLGLSPGVRARLNLPGRGEKPAERSKFGGLIKQR